MKKTAGLKLWEEWRRREMHRNQSLNRNSLLCSGVGKLEGELRAAAEEQKKGRRFSILPVSIFPPIAMGSLHWTGPPFHGSTSEPISRDFKNNSLSTLIYIKSLLIQIITNSNYNSIYNQVAP